MKRRRHARRRYALKTSSN